MKKYLLISLILLAVILSGFLAYQRFIIESQNRGLELVLDYKEARALSLLNRISLNKLLKDFKKAGISSLALTEETLIDAEISNELIWTSSHQSEKVKRVFKGLKINPNRIYILPTNPKSKDRIENELKIILGKEKVKSLGKVLEVDSNEEELLSLGLGINTNVLTFLKASGFKVAGRLINNPKYNIQNIGLKIANAKTPVIIFDGEEILGYPDYIFEVSQALKKSRTRYGFIEIVKQDGDQELLRLMGDEVFRVHSFSKEELEKTKPAEALERFVRAARERNVRLLYLRPFLNLSVKENLNYISGLKERLTKAGFSIGNVSSPKFSRISRGQVIILSLGVTAGLLLLLEAFIKIPAMASYAILILGVLISFFSPMLLLQKSLALISALTFPSLAIIYPFRPETRDQRPETFGLRSTVYGLRSLWITGYWLLITCLGALLIIGLLTDSRFMIGSELFTGIKLSLILPMLVIGAYFFLKGEEEEIPWSQLWQRVKEFLKIPLSMWQMLLGLIGLGALALFILRSGNFGLPVTVFEKYVRGMLEEFLYIRPRFKEFLVGYPFLILTTYYFLKGQRTWLWLLLPIGAIGPISFINTFCHIHTPLLVSVIRSINGLVLGAIAGLILIGIYEGFNLWLLRFWQSRR